MLRVQSLRAVDSTDGDYLARYPRRYAVVAALCTLFYAALLAFFIVRTAKASAIALSILMLAGSLYLLIDWTGTSVRFTHEGFIVRQIWFRRFTERYTDVCRVVLKTRAIQVDFVDGRRVKFYRASGAPDKVAAYLETHLPEWILSEDA